MLLGLLNSGCFVLTSEWRYKPDARGEKVEFRGDTGGLRYSRLLHFSGFDLAVGAKDGPPRWEAGFLFYASSLSGRANCRQAVAC